MSLLTMITLICLGLLLGFFLVVGLHEAGHAWMAYAFGVKIKRISIGFGKPFFSWKQKSGITWIWARWPLGGYVQLFNTRTMNIAKKDKPYCFDQQPAYVRLAILVSGVVVNTLTACLILCVVFVLGYKQSLPVVKSVSKPSVAATVGIRAHDKIMRVEQYPTPSWREVGIELLMHLGKSAVAITVQNEAGIERQIELNLSHWKYKQEKNALLGGIGIEPDTSHIDQEQRQGLPLLRACQKAFRTTVHLIFFFLVLLKQLMTGMIPLAVLMGPIGLLETMTTSFMQGISVFLYFISALSLAVAVVNVLPIPGLDGGLMLYTLIEKICGKPISLALEVLLHRLAFILFWIFILQLMLNDLRRIFIY